MAKPNTFTQEEKRAYLESKQKQREELEERVRNLVDSFRDSDTFKSYLSQMSDFHRRCKQYLHRYSPNNLLLIVMQDPTAQIVGAANAWRKMGRFVKKGEHSHIMVWAPMREAVVKDKLDQYGNPVLKPDGTPERVPERDANGRVKRRFNGHFKLEPVFDVSQTDGEPLPELTHELKNPVEHFDDYAKALQDASPLPIHYSDDPAVSHIPLRGAKGLCHYGERLIIVKSGMSQEQTLKTLIHEVTHAKLHDPKELKADLAETGETPSRSEKEVQAECTAFLVCEHFGFDTSDYSIPYIMSWGEDKKLTPLTKSLDVILGASDEIIDQMETQLWVDMGIDETLYAAEYTDVPSQDASVSASDSPQNSEKADGDRIMRLLSDKTIAALWGMGFKMRYEEPLTASDKPTLKLRQATEKGVVCIDVLVSERRGELVAPDFDQCGKTAISVFHEGETAPFFEQSDGTLVDQIRAFNELGERTDRATEPNRASEERATADEDAARALLTDPDVEKLLAAGYAPKPQMIETPEGLMSGLSLVKDNGLYELRIAVVPRFAQANDGSTVHAMQSNMALMAIEKIPGETPCVFYEASFDRPIAMQMRALRDNATYYNLSTLRQSGFEFIGCIDAACRFAKDMGEAHVSLTVPTVKDESGTRMDFASGNIRAGVHQQGNLETISRIYSIPRAIEQVNQRIGSLRSPARASAASIDPISYARKRQREDQLRGKGATRAASPEQTRQADKPRTFTMER